MLYTVELHECCSEGGDVMKYKVLFSSVLLFFVWSQVHGIETWSFLKNPGTFNRLVSMLPAVKVGGAAAGATMRDVLVKRLKKYTVFAPTDVAFNNFGKVGILREKGR